MRGVYWKKSKISRSHPTSYHMEINTKRITDLPVRAKTMKLLEENIGEKNLCELGVDKEFLDMTPNA